MAAGVTRREFLKYSALASASFMTPPFGFACAKDFGFESLPALRQLAQSKGMFFGTALEPGLFQIDPNFRSAIAKECNLVVTENGLKWRNVHPSPGRWNFTSADTLMAYARSNGMKMRGHALVYSLSFPDWAKDEIDGDASKAEAVMEEHIATIVEHYRGELLSWDVLNEAIEPAEGRDDGLRRCELLDVLGPKYIDLAFRLAAKADPSTQLVYNDFSIESDPVKADAVLALLRRLKDKGVPIHAVGLQSHISTNKTFKPLSQFCKNVKSMGLDVLVTELDVWEAIATEDDSERDRLVADKTREFLETLFAVTVPKQIVTWSLSDRHSWLSNPKTNSKNKLGRHIRGLPLDDDFGRKPMWKVLHDVLAQVNA